MRSVKNFGIIAVLNGSIVLASLIGVLGSNSLALAASSHVSAVSTEVPASNGGYRRLDLATIKRMLSAAGIEATIDADGDLDVSGDGVRFWIRYVPEEDSYLFFSFFDLGPVDSDAAAIQELNRHGAVVLFVEAEPGTTAALLAIDGHLLATEDDVYTAMVIYLADIMQVFENVS